jgi:uncharacterized membrane protein (DUF2068 family)
MATMGSTGRTYPQTLAAALLVWNGVGAILYAGIVPLPPFSAVPVPLVAQVLGIATLAAAVGVFRVQAWGRVLAVGLTTLGLALEVLRLVDQVPRSISPLEVVRFFAGVGYSVLLLWLLLRRWPQRRRGVQE